MKTKAQIEQEIADVLSESGPDPFEDAKAERDSIQEEVNAADAGFGAKSALNDEI